ncbi:MAG: hypothetical protein ACREJX_17365 [Polyangiaceae bacterium]
MLFRRAATPAEVEEAIQVAKAAETEAAAVLKRIAKKRELPPPEPPPPETVAVAAPQPDEVQDEPTDDTPAFRDLEEFTDELDAAEN